MTKLTQLKETCITLGITIPFVLLSAGTTLPTPQQGEKESKLKANIQTMMNTQEDNTITQDHINTHTNSVRNGVHTNKHTNTTTYRELS